MSSYRITFADGHRIIVEAVSEAAARIRAYRFEPSQPIACIEAC